MQDDGARGSGLQDEFAELTGETTTAAPAVPASAAAAPESPEIQMPAMWVGKGDPPRPERVQDDIDTKTRQAAEHRERAQRLGEQEKALDADVDVATQLVAARTQDRDELKSRMDALSARAAELQSDEARKDPDVDRARAEVVELKRQLGETHENDLMPPDGSPAPASAAPETDPAKVAALREQLTQAESRYEQLVAERGTASAPELARIKAEQDALAPQLKVAESALSTQQQDLAELESRADALEHDATQALDQARGLEAEAKNLTDAMPDYRQIWDTWAAEHPDQAKVTDLGTLEVKVEPRERAMLYAQGRREEAGRLEQQASDTDEAAADAGNGARSRLELAQRNDDEVASINQRVEAVNTRITAMQADAREANDQADKLAAESDRMTKEAAQLRAQGRTEAADTMDARAKAMTDESIKAKFRADDIERDARNLGDSVAGDRTRVETLTHQATQLRQEATTLSAQETTLQQQSAKLREDAQTRDHIAQEVEDRLQSGQAFEFHLVDDRMGESITLDVPAGPPPYQAPPADPAGSDTTAAAADPTAAGATADGETTGDGDQVAAAVATTDDVLGDDLGDTAGTPLASAPAAATDGVDPVGDQVADALSAADPAGADVTAPATTDALAAPADAAAGADAIDDSVVAAPVDEASADFAESADVSAPVDTSLDDGLDA